MEIAGDPEAAPGRVVQVNVSAGGVPKRPVASAHAGRLGLDGDDHDDRTVHGGPFRAVCLYSLEAIGRVQADGHPIAPGSVGENLTLEGIDLSALATGDRLTVGPDVVLEITKPADPCETISASFTGGRIGRISIRTHPRDSRLYARVLAEGIVRPGDPVRVLPPAPDSDAGTHLLLDRVDSNERNYSLLEWRAAAEGGVDVRIVDDGELAMAAAPGVPDENFNVALGLRQLPHLLPDAIRFFELNGVVGWLYAAEPPWPGAVAERIGSVLVGDPRTVSGGAEARGGVAGSGDAGEPLAGLVVRRIDGHDAAGVLAWECLVLPGFGYAGAVAGAWMAAAPGIARDHRVHLFLAELDGEPAGAGAMFVHRGLAGLGPGTVLPAFRRRGVHAALIRERCRVAAGLGLDLVAAWAAADGQSERNMLRLGMRRAWVRGLYRT